MQTKQIVQASANVIRIVNLSKGDLYKRFEDSSYSDKLRYGVVRNIYNDGETTFVESTEYEYKYGEVKANLYIMRGDKDVSIFPATLEELQFEFEGAESRIKEDIQNKKKELAEKEQALIVTQKLISGELQKQIQSAEFKEMTQAEYNEKIRIQEAKKLEATSVSF